MPPPLMSQRAIPPNVRGPPPHGPMGQGPRGSLLGQPPGQFMRGPFDPRGMMNNMRPPFGGPQGNAPMLPNLQVFYLFILSFVDSNLACVQLATLSGFAWYKQA